MKIRLSTPAFAIIAIVSGAVVLLGYFIPLLQGLRGILLNWALTLTAVVLLVGIVNLSLVHIKKIRTEEKNSFYSLFLVIALVITFVLAVIFGPDWPWTVWIYNYILLPVETSLVALLAVVLIYAIARLFWRGVTPFNLLFAGAAIFVLAIPAVLAWMPDLMFLSEFQAWINQIWALAGARAILMGVALGAIATGLRVLVGADRPYES